MGQIAAKLTLLGGLLLVTTVACTDRSDSRASSSSNLSTPAVEQTPKIEQPATYTVVAGDFLSDIAERFGISLDELVEANDIENPALIEVGQVLVIPGGETVAIPDGTTQPAAETVTAAETTTAGATEAVPVDQFAAVAPAERYPEIYPQDKLPPPAPPTPLEELRDRIAEWPWPPRETMVRGGVIAGFALCALVVGLMLTSLEFQTRRWIVRATPRALRQSLRAWGSTALLPRRTAVAGWRRAGSATRTAWHAVLAVEGRYRRVREALITGWHRSEPTRTRIAERAGPALDVADDVLRRASAAALERTRELADTVRDRAPGATETFNHVGMRATNTAVRGVRGAAERARREVFEPTPAQRQWRSRMAGELADAFERDQLEVRYVPVINLDSHDVSAVEAHLFWLHPQRGLIGARDIHTATADHPELSAALLEFLIEQSCSFIKERVDQRFPSAQLIVPITLEQIVESEPLAAIDRGLTTANLAIDRLKVSMSEQHALQDPVTAAAFIRNLRSMGIGVHLDDYGMAGSDDLRHLGVSSVTVDLAAAGNRAAALEALEDAVEAAQDLRLPVTARHKETDGARALQQRLGCAYEAVGMPQLADAFVSEHIEEKQPEPTPVAAPAEAGAAGAAEAASAGVAAVETGPTGARQAQRPAGPLRMTRPSLARPPLATNGAVAAEAGGEETAPVEAEGEAAEVEGAEAASDATGSGSGSGESTASGRPVDAA